MNSSEEIKKNTKGKPNEVERYERLQLAAERQIGNLGKAYETHASLIKWSVIVIGGVGGFFFFSNVQDFKKDTETNVNARLTQLTAKVDDEFARMTNRIEMTIANASVRIDKGIDARFEKENIERLMEEKVREKVAKLTDKLISERIGSAVEPRIAEITNRIGHLDQVVSEAKVAADVIGQSTELALAAAAASYDDREGWNKLVIARDNPNAQVSLTANRIVSEILRRLRLEETLYETMKLNWAALKIDPNTASLADYLKAINENPGWIGVQILKTFSAQDRFPKEEKLASYSYLLAKSASVKMVDAICRVLDREAKLDLNMLGTPQFQRWVESELSAVTITNRTDLLRTNPQNVSAYLERAEAYQSKGELDKAVADYKRAIELNPDNLNTHNSLAWMLATSEADSIRDGKEAVRCALKACEESKWKIWNYVGTLAAAYAEAGDYDQALRYQKKVMAMEGKTEQQIADEKRRLSLFEQHRPCREPLKK